MVPTFSVIIIIIIIIIKLMFLKPQYRMDISKPPSLTFLPTLGTLRHLQVPGLWEWAFKLLLRAVDPSSLLRQTSQSTWYILKPLPSSANAAK